MTDRIINNILFALLCPLLDWADAIDTILAVAWIDGESGYSLSTRTSFGHYMCFRRWTAGKIFREPVSDC